MGQLVLYICLTALLPIALLLIYLEKRARRVMMSFMCGILSCLLAYFLNTFLIKLVGLSSKDYSVTLAPIVEEFLKFVPLFIFNAVVRKGKRQTVAMAFALGVGFCVVENFFYLFNGIETASVVWVIFRCIGTGLMHSMSTSIIAIGLYIARDKNFKSILYSIASLVFAILYHLIYNFLVSSDILQFVGILLPIVSYVVLFIFTKKELVKEFFKDDAEKADKNDK